VAIDPPKDEDGKGYKKQVTIKSLSNALNNPNTTLLG